MEAFFFFAALAYIVHVQFCAVNEVLFKLKKVCTVVLNPFSSLQVREHEQNCSENVSAPGRG